MVMARIGMGTVRNLMLMVSILLAENYSSAAHLPLGREEWNAGLTFN